MPDIKIGRVETKKVAKLQEWAPNDTIRSITTERYQALKDKMIANGFQDVLKLAADGKTVLGGNHRVKILKEMGISEVPVIITDAKTDKEMFAVALDDNQDFARYEREELAELAMSLDIPEIELKTFEINFGRTTSLDQLLRELGPDGDSAGSLQEQFGVPPFSVLDTKQGYWQDRKREWLDLGIKSEVGRDIDPTSVSKDAPAYMADRGNNEGGSIFDPVLCEIMYKWFAPKHKPGKILPVLDPFAGGSVRGIVAAHQGLGYTGIELRGEQVNANYANAKGLGIEPTKSNLPCPKWIKGNSLKMNDLLPKDKTYDFILSCPPYANLEVYSDDPADISNMDYPQFIDIYRKIIKLAVARLKPNRFAVFVVSKVRNKKGSYHNFVANTVKAFEDAGASHYNELILTTALGSLPIRAGRQFNNGRKVGRAHQNVLCFYKGNPATIKDNFGDIDFSDTEE